MALHYPTKYHLWLWAVNPFVWIVWLVDFLLWLATVIGPVRSLLSRVLSSSAPLSVAAGNEEKGIRIRAPKPLQPDDGVQTGVTLFELLEAAFSKFGDFKALGTLRNSQNDVQWESFAVLGERSLAFGLGLRKMGMQPLPLSASRACTDHGAKLPENEHSLLVFQNAGAEWITAAIGAMGQSMPIVTLHASLSIVAVASVIKDTRAPTILCHINDVMRVRSLSLSCPTLKNIVYTGPQSEEPIMNSTFHVSGRSITVVSLEDVIASGKKENSDNTFVEASSFRPVSESLCLITFTSGSTGNPKGVMIQHSSAVAAVNSFTESLNLRPTNVADNHQDVFLAHQPPARVLEFVLEMTMLSAGAAIGYVSGSALSLACFKTIQPTFSCLVPKALEMLQKDAEEELKMAGLLARSMFAVCALARSLARENRSTPLSSYILRRGKAVLGGRMKLCISSGGALNQDVQLFFRMALSVPVAQLYGLTEACGAGAMQLCKNSQVNNVGGPMPGVEIRLDSCLDEFGGALALDGTGLPYRRSDRCHMGRACLGRGEIMVRGSCVASGYYGGQATVSDELSLTSEVSRLHGWCASGDIGVWDPNGGLIIVDRLKNLVKLKCGEYVALEAMERAFNKSAFVDCGNGGVCCFADSSMEQPVALVQASMYDLKRWADENRVDYMSFEELCQNPVAIQMVTKDLNLIGQAAVWDPSRHLVNAPWAPHAYMNVQKFPLAKHELLKTVALIPGSGDRDEAGPIAFWSSENGCLTVSGQLNRREINKACENILAEICG